MLIAVYGTLRKCGRLNVLLSGERFLGEDEIYGFELYIYAGLPMVDYGKGYIKVEVYDVRPETFMAIDEIEKNAGYVDVDVETRFGKAKMWINRMAKKGRKIESGDYCG